MAPVTEIMDLLLVPGATIEDSSSETGKAFADLRAIMSSISGIQRHYWGRKVEDANRLVWSIDWDDYSLHAKVQATPVYQKFMDKAKLVFDLEKEPPVITHHEILPFPPASEVRESPVTELVTCTIDAADDRTAVDKAASGLMSTISAGDDPGSAKATAVGWSVETHDRPEAKGGKVLGLGMLIGWNSVEDHMKMRETKQFGEAIGLVRPHLLPSVPKWEMCHVAFKRG